MPTVTLSPIGNGVSFLGQSLVLLNGGFINTYQAGTTTPLATYTTNAGNIANSNPIILNSDGRPPQEIWLIVGSAYKFVVSDALSNVIATYDNIVGINAGDASTSTFTQTGSGAVVRTEQSKLAENFSLKDYGAVEDGATDDTTAVGNALANAGNSNGVVLVNPGSALVTSMSNPYGLEFSGSGEIITPYTGPVSGGYKRLNHYADKNKYAIGKEYLYRAWQRLLSGLQGAAGGQLKGFIYGDSTIAGGHGETILVQNLLFGYFVDRGIPNVNLTNLGVAGTQISDLNAIPNLSTTTDLLIIKYGINDGTNPLNTRLATFQTTLRSKLAAIRAATNGALSQVSILLIGPNSTNDSPNQRDARWYDQLRGIYVQAARDYQCAYFDTYAWLQDSLPAATLWMDQPYGGGDPRCIHPLDNMNAWMWGAIFDWAFGLCETRNYATNRFQNQGAFTQAASLASLPSAYLQGLFINRAPLANGWPEDGTVITFKNVDGGALQMLFPFAAGRARCYFRDADSVGNTWSRFTGQYENITLSNGWANGGGFASAQACIEETGHVQCKGLIAAGTVTAGTLIGTLPTGMFPAEQQIFVCAANVNTVQIKAQTNGQLIAQTALDATYTSLAQIRFKAA